MDVYPLCLGGNPFGWTADESASHAVLDEYADAGGNFLDTADVYSAWQEGNKGGESETIIGSWLKNRKRDEVVLATKVAKLPGYRGLSEKNVRTCVEASLRRLQTEYIDLYYAHEFDPNVSLEESVAVFASLQKEGKIREVGLSNFTAQQIRDWIAETQRQGVQAPVAVQPAYNLVWRRSFESSLEAVCKEFDLGVIPYWSLASGLLTGKYRSQEDITGARESSLKRQASPRAFEVINVVREIAAEHNVEPSSIAIAWLLTRPTITAPLASARVPEQVPPVLEGVTLTLTEEDVIRLDELSEGLGNDD